MREHLLEMIVHVITHLKRSRERQLLLHPYLSLSVALCLSMSQFLTFSICLFSGPLAARTGSGPGWLAWKLPVLLGLIVVLVHTLTVCALSLATLATLSLRVTDVARNM